MTATAPPSIHPLIGRLGTALDARFLDARQFDAWTPQAGHALAVFLEDPVLHRETLDLAVIVPELARAFAWRFRVGVLLPAPARSLQARYGLRRWPAFVVLRDGAYVGAVEGLRNWEEYLQEVERLLEAEPTRPPTIGVAVKTAGAAAAGCAS